MGTFHVAVQVGGIAGDRFEMVEALVDTGASMSIFPTSLLQQLGVTPTETRTFRLADESGRAFQVGPARVRTYGKESFAVVGFGEPGMQPILGALTLEDMGLGVDPSGRRLIDVQERLMTVYERKP
jgi:clan AA aspartic protease